MNFLPTSVEIYILVDEQNYILTLLATHHTFEHDLLVTLSTSPLLFLVLTNAVTQCNHLATFR